jgi:hypothetical protein
MVSGSVQAATSVSRQLRNSRILKDGGRADDDRVADVGDGRLDEPARSVDELEAGRQCRNSWFRASSRPVRTVRMLAPICRNGDRCRVAVLPRDERPDRRALTTVPGRSLSSCR